MQIIPLSRTAPVPAPAERRTGLRRACPDDRAAPVRDRESRPLGQILIDDGAVNPADLFKAVVIQQRQQSPLGNILLAHGWVEEAALARALSQQWRCSAVDLRAAPPDPRLIDRADAAWCLANGCVPWRVVGGTTFVATERPEDFAAIQPRLMQIFGPVRMLLCPRSAARDAVLHTSRTHLARRAEHSVPAELSCRTRDERRLAWLALAGMALLSAGLYVAPVALLGLVCGWVVLTLAAGTLLRLLAFRATLKEDAERSRSRARLGKAADQPAEMTGRLPVISVMVPMFREEHIADRLVGRLARLTYPRELTDCLLVIEETDTVTREALRGVRLPHWMRVVTVPDGPIRTKPRACNYALDFCRGSIIGVWDAEDRPEPDQLHRVARQFAAADCKVACLQGALDFYNPRTNWLSRCFTIEYSAWFRGVLPGLARMGMVVPLGGTTFFIRREALEAAGRWDGWNVTEDADLGARLHRMGYRTQILDSTTHEEANCHAVPWVRQRSRWLKGFAITWGVHMSRPLRLWRELGPAAFVAFNLQMWGTVQQFLLAPLMWSFWLLALGLPHPLAAPLESAAGGWGGPALFTLFVLAEVLNTVIGVWSVRRTHPGLRAWVPTMYFYFPLACLAAWKAVYEIVVKPFYWDKTMHGVYDAADAPPEAPVDAALALLPLRDPHGLAEAALPRPVAALAPVATRSRRGFAGWPAADPQQLHALYEDALGAVAARPSPGALEAGGAAFGGQTGPVEADSASAPLPREDLGPGAGIPVLGQIS